MANTKTYSQAKKIIEGGRYESKEAMMEILDVFLMGNRITADEYKELVELLDLKEAKKQLS